MRLAVAITAWLLCASALAGPVRDSTRPRDGKKTPWSQGVSDAAQQRALQLFRDGNVFFEQSKYTEAVAKYELALAAWDHPNIRFNMAICLINMRQPLVAWSHLQQALRFGEAPLGKQHHAEALTYVAVLESSLAELTVKSPQPEVRVMVDGGQVLAGTGAHTMKLLAGKHQLVASRPGYITESRALDLPAGKPVIEAIELRPELVKIRRENYERRWAWWLPWSVAGSSVVLGLAGSGLYLSSRAQMQRYDEAFAQACPIGCEEIPAALQDRKSSAERKSGIAIAMWSVAGGLAITGGVMAFLNRPRRLEDRTAVPMVTVSRDYVGIGISLVLD